MNEKKLKTFPQPTSLKKMIGPSFVILAMGLGSGEIILWPYLVSNYGLGICWGALLGITFQYFLNMEIERYALIRGESVFVGLAKKFKLAPYWFIISTFLGWGLPGIIAVSAQIFSNLFAIKHFNYLAIILLIIIGIFLSVSKTVYNSMEKITKIIIALGVPFILILTIIISKDGSLINLFKGFIGKGDGYFFIPTGISLVTFLGAFAYAGAGGNLNLTQSIYIKEKGYGMGKYSQKIAGLFCSKKLEEIKLEGEKFEINKANINKFKKWWKLINAEHLIVFWFVGIFTMSLLMLLSFNTVYGLANNQNGIAFILNQGTIISNILFPAISAVFLFVLGVMLFQTQLGVMDSTSRIMAENLAIKKIAITKNKKIYFIFLWSQIIFGCLLLLFNFYEPKTLIIIGAVINAFSMFIYTGMIFYMNNKSLEKEFRPVLWRKIILTIIFLFFGVFSLITLISKLH